MMNETPKAAGSLWARVALPLIIVGVVIVAILLVRSKEREEMLPSEKGAKTPPIDLNAPGETKTATFAMG